MSRLSLQVQLLSTLLCYKCQVSVNIVILYPHCKRYLHNSHREKIFLKMNTPIGEAASIFVFMPPKELRVAY